MSESIIDLGRNRVGRRVGGSLGLKTVPGGFTDAILQFTANSQTRWVHGSKWFFNITVGSAADVLLGKADYDSVQDAIDSANSTDSIFIIEGTYTENLVITKELVIWGEGHDTLIDGTVQWSAGADGGLVKFLTFGDDASIDSGVVDLIITDCWMAIDKVLTDNNLSQALNLVSLLNTNTWLTGLDGGLVITSGNTVTLAPGDIKDYSSIDVQSGGTLEVSAVGSTGDWTIIGCTGNCNVDGDVKLINGEHAGGTFATVAPDTTVLSYTTTQSLGGVGGDAPGFTGSSEASGNGGGGASPESNGSAASPTDGGDGGSTGDGSGGAGGVITGNDGGDGFVPVGAPTFGVGPGGGGGSRGSHGQSLYLKIGGDFTGTGFIDAAGQTGGDGGDGGPSGTDIGANIDNPGGGGGAAGGSGGKIQIRYAGSLTFNLANLLVTVGTSGTGGAASVTGQGGAGTAGAAGTNGSIGAVDLTGF